ncbi:helix-turn-helix domain-containing protein [Paenibacillus caui]|uniref:helix-turn-helix domain-containing protein n=1 Tax=Paenibacillus caui TaxID=2873927 RepID=UPI001F3F2BD9|nr:helix-turn-helix transcriptional regulator [Paenibacillus caui]
MEPATMIREELEEYLTRENMSINHFAEVTKINAGTLSNILNGNRPIALQQLDRITSGMGLTDGYYYDLYVDECFFHAAPDWRRLGPFLHRCAELNKLECIEQTTRLMMDNLSYIPLLFNMAEQLLHAGKSKSAALLYECIAESEKMQHSERLALCHYRLFTLGISKDQNRNLLIAAQFESFVDRLDECYQFDAINDLINAFAALRRWDKVRELAEKLKVKATIHYELNGRMKPEETKKQIVFYIMYAYLELGEAYFYFENYESALHFVSLYADCNWVKEPNADEMIIIHQFQDWAEGNRYMYQLMAGKVEVLPNYVEYISTRENEIFSALCEIVIAANRFDINIDFVLDQYKSHFMYQEQSSRIGKINEQYTDDRYVSLLADLGIYYLKKKDYERGLGSVLDSFAFAIEIRSGYGMLKCAGLFEQYRSFASDAAIHQYKIYMGEVQKLNEKKIGFTGSYM